MLLPRSAVLIYRLRIALAGLSAERINLPISVHVRLYSNTSGTLQPSTCKNFLDPVTRDLSGLARI